MKFALIILTTLAISGCATDPIWKSTPAKTQVENSLFIAELTPVCPGGYYGCNSFEIAIKNKTNSNIELDWNKTLYVANGQTSGGFMLEGTVYAERNNPKQPDIIFSGGSFKKRIWPNQNVRYVSPDQSVDPGWRNDRMGEGEHGIYLSVSIGGKVINEKLTTQIISELPK